MFKLTAFIFLTLQVALGTTNTVDLPPEIVSCLDDIIIPATRIREFVYQSCRTLPPDNEQLQCIINNNKEFRETGGVSKCQNNINELPLPTQRTLALAYELNEIRKDRYMELPQNLLHCIDSLKSMAQRTLQRVKDCETSVSVAVDLEADTAHPYKECDDKMYEIATDPEFLKCDEMTRSLTNDQHQILGTYFLKVYFNL